MDKKYLDAVKTLQIRISQLKEATNNIIENEQNARKNLKEYKFFLEKISASFFPILVKLKSNISGLTFAFLSELDENVNEFLKLNDLELYEGKIKPLKFKNIKRDAEDLNLLASSGSALKNSLETKLNKVFKMLASEDEMSALKMKEDLNEINNAQKRALETVGAAKNIFEEEDKISSKITTMQTLINEYKKKLRVTA